MNTDDEKDMKEMPELIDICKNVEPFILQIKQMFIPHAMLKPVLEAQDSYEFNINKYKELHFKNHT